MKGKHLNSGLRGGLWDKKHRDKMGSAVWLFGWLVHRQTLQRGGEGLVLRGRPLTYAEIGEDMDESPRTIEKWMATLRAEGYITVKHSCYRRMVIRILKAKKFKDAQIPFWKTEQKRDGEACGKLVDSAKRHPAKARDSAPEPAGFKQRTENEQTKNGMELWNQQPEGRKHGQVLRWLGNQHATDDAQRKEHVQRAASLLGRSKSFTEAVREVDECELIARRNLLMRQAADLLRAGPRAITPEQVVQELQRA